MCEFRKHRQGEYRCLLFWDRCQSIDSTQEQLCNIQKALCEKNNHKHMHNKLQNGAFYGNWSMFPYTKTKNGAIGKVNFNTELILSNEKARKKNLR